MGQKMRKDTIRTICLQILSSYFKNSITKSLCTNNNKWTLNKYSMFQPTAWTLTSKTSSNKISPIRVQPEQLETQETKSTSKDQAHKVPYKVKIVFNSLQVLLI